MNFFDESQDHSLETGGTGGEEDSIKQTSEFDNSGEKTIDENSDRDLLTKNSSLSCRGHLHSEILPKKEGKFSHRDLLKPVAEKVENHEPGCSEGENLASQISDKTIPLAETTSGDEDKESAISESLKAGTPSSSDKSRNLDEGPARLTDQEMKTSPELTSPATLDSLSPQLQQKGRTTTRSIDIPEDDVRSRHSPNGHQGHLRPASPTKDRNAENPIEGEEENERKKDEDDSGDEIDQDHLGKRYLPPADVSTSGENPNTEWKVKKKLSTQTNEPRRGPPANSMSEDYDHQPTPPSSDRHIEPHVAAAATRNRNSRVKLFDRHLWSSDRNRSKWADK